MTRTLDAAAFRRTVGLFPSGVTVVTTVLDSVIHGMTANAFCSVSLNPLLVLVCVERSAGLHGLLERSGVFAVSLLAADQEDASRWFATARRPGGRDQFDPYRWEPAPVTGSPVLLDAVAYVDCRLHEVHVAGDHSICIGEVRDVGRLGGAAPLVWYGGGYHRLADA